MSERGGSDRTVEQIEHDDESSRDGASGDGGHPDSHRDGGKIFWVATGAGWLVIAGALIGLWIDRRDSRPFDLARWVIGGAVLHDFVWLTGIALIGAVLAKLCRGRVPRVLAWALATSAVLVLVAWPFLRGYGRRADNPSLLPRNYGRGLLAYIAVVWLLAAVVAVAGWRRRRRSTDRHVSA